MISKKKSLYSFVFEKWNLIWLIKIELKCNGSCVSLIIEIVKCKQTFLEKDNRLVHINIEGDCKNYKTKSFNATKWLLLFLMVR